MKPAVTGTHSEIGIVCERERECCCLCYTDLQLIKEVPSPLSFSVSAELVVREPLTELRETVTTQSPACMTKSPNKRNKLTVTAQPLLVSSTFLGEGEREREGGSTKLVTRG